ncbi:recombinase zinc beta ribbon domain-containing protein [Bradyrhizobium sp. Cham227]|nr:recombinase zinc beta ribbon domain-containing protein [Bradyrhizobium brasilense]
MANQGRLAEGAGLLQGIAICGRCGRRMSMRYTGSNADYPVYCCRSDRDQQGSALCQEGGWSSIALVPDQIEIALAVGANWSMRAVSSSTSGRFALSAPLRGRTRAASV